MATPDQLVNKIRALEAAGLDASAERAELLRVQAQDAEAMAGHPVAPPAEPPDSRPDEVFLEANLDSFERGGGGQWKEPPKTTGIKAAICRGISRPDFVTDQIWWLFENDGGERFKGVLVCGAITNLDPSKSGAWKLKDICTTLGIPYEVNRARGGIVLKKSLDGLECDVDWEYTTIQTKSGPKTEMRIQDVYARGSTETAIG